MAKLVEATGAAQVAAVRELFAEYARMVDEPCCFVDFERELDVAARRRTGCCSPDDAAGCVALRFLDAETAEMKRLYVRSAHRGKGLGRALAEAAIARGARGRLRAHRARYPAEDARSAGALRACWGFKRIRPYLREPDARRALLRAQPFLIRLDAARWSSARARTGSRPPGRRAPARRRAPTMRSTGQSPPLTSTCGRHARDQRLGRVVVEPGDRVDAFERGDAPPGGRRAD